MTLGVMTLPSSCCAINVTTQTQINVDGPSIIPNIAAGANDNQGPKMGLSLLHQRIIQAMEYKVTQ